MSYLTLSEAAEYVNNKTGLQIEPAAMLRAGVHGVLLISAPFSSLMRNLTAHKNDDVLGLLVIPPRHLLEIETEGQTKIIGAFSLDGKTGYSPQVMRTRDQLRVLVSELDRLMPYWGTDKPQQTAPEQDTAPAPVVTDQTPERRLALLRSFGGSAKYARGEWTFKGIGTLAKSEQSNGFKRCDTKTIRADLKEAAQAERDAKSAGFASGLGQR